jgi:hypothetical protein
MIDFSVARPIRKQSLPFRQTKFLVGHEYESLRLITMGRLQVSQKLLLNIVEMLLAAWKVNSHDPAPPRPHTDGIFPAVLPAEWVTRINLSEALVQQYLCSKAF